MTIVIALIVSSACVRFGITSGGAVTVFVGMARECHPVWRDLALRRIYEGQPVDDVIERTKPVQVVRHGQFVEIAYQEPFSFSGIHIFARDDKLVRAMSASCTWEHTFFNSMSDEDDQQMRQSIETNQRTVQYDGKTIQKP